MLPERALGALEHAVGVWVVGSCVVGRASWVVGRGSCVVGRASCVVRRVVRDSSCLLEKNLAGRI